MISRGSNGLGLTGHTGELNVKFRGCVHKSERSVLANWDTVLERIASGKFEERTEQWSRVRLSPDGGYVIVSLLPYGIGATEYLYVMTVTLEELKAEFDRAFEGLALTGKDHVDESKPEVEPYTYNTRPQGDDEFWGSYFA